MTEQALAAKGLVRDAVKARVKVEAKWADHLQLDRAEIVFVRTVEQRSLMLSGNRVTQETAPNAGLK
ncbi:MAG: hypothetical protein J7K65_01285 [Planctomycetes bacterium]|nr:hypothetical protein [Planctomycetota bacterium]